ncbi:MAG TPA: CBS domain-containing protein [Saprospiraceae bacterium]|nr:CBS domain-containing protein [Saprospiraceae bacterium]HZV43996.1 CBS domain-containing protein [Saprospiraceae bacterium]
MISVKQLLDHKKRNAIFTLQPDNMVIEALELMATANIGAIMITSKGKLAGIFSERDYARKGIIQGRKAKTTPLSEVMIHDVYTVNPKTQIDECMEMFTNKFIRHLPVIENGEIIGMISIGDVVSAIMEEQKDHIQFLEQYISGT